MLKRIVESFTLQPDKKFEDFFFEKGEDGFFIFYPWGYPDKAFLIDNCQKKKITLIFYIAVIMFALIALGLVCLLGIPDIFSTFGVMAISINLALYIAIFFFYAVILNKVKNYNSIDLKNKKYLHKDKGQKLIEEIFKNDFYSSILILICLFINPSNILYWILGSLAILLNLLFLKFCYKKALYFKNAIDSDF